MARTVCVRNIIDPDVDPVWDDYSPFPLMIREGQCVQEVKQFRPHGFLCPKHYLEQSEKLPRPARKPYKSYVKDPAMLLSDTNYVLRIGKLEAAAIKQLREQNRIEVRKFGKYDPLQLQTVKA